MLVQKAFAVDAPAKINLHLEIIGRRDDGYHDLRSLFLMVNLCDRLRLKPGGEGGVRLSLSGLGGVDPGRNSVLRAVELFRRETGMSDGLDVALEKRIPLGAGLGGGSSDAAAALRLLNAAGRRPLPEAALAKLGAAIGSDVPFFLKAASAVVEGRGEIVIPIAPGPKRFFVLLVPDFTVLTTEAYRWYDELPLSAAVAGPTRVELVNAFTHAAPGEWNYFNSFSSVLGARFPVYAALQKTLRSSGALFTGISGSGSAYFGVFSGADQAREALPRLDGGFQLAEVVETLAAAPAVVEESAGPV